ncbi:hypothetical protein B0O99DRAFT_499679, partial [Bisporella sp. PMI_857]
LTMTSTIDALKTLCSSVPEWHTRLDELNSQIAQRQIELARLTENRLPTARSVRNKGSTESLRPNDGDENPFLASDQDTPEDGQKNPFDTPQRKASGSAVLRPNSSDAAQARNVAVMTPPPPKATSNPRASPNALARQSSQPTSPAQTRTAPALLRKRKTESLASQESLVPKYKTRSMIIVYYDSAVQTAFEELVKFVSTSRNAMRKGRMEAKMAEMKKAAELEVEGDDSDAGNTADTQYGNLRAAQKKVVDRLEVEGHATSPNADVPLPVMRFTSTRNMGPRNHKADNIGSTMNLGMLRSYRRSGDGAQNIFEELDKGLEWCQSRCEHAAHQFLREGDCSTEIAEIQKRLGEVKICAERELEKRRAAAAAAPAFIVARPDAPGEGKSRQLKSMQMRKDYGGMSKGLQVNDNNAMEVDEDEGVDDMDIPDIVFKRSRDIGR